MNFILKIRFSKQYNLFFLPLIFEESCQMVVCISTIASFLATALD